MHSLAIQPSEVEIGINQTGQEVAVPVCIKNLDARPRSFRIKPPTTRWFALRGIGHTHRLAPGLSITFEVVFKGSQLEGSANQEYHDTIKIACESVSAVQEPPLELWVHARPPAPQLYVQGSLQLGVVAVGSRAKQQVQLVNRGTAPADFTITWDKSLPVTVEPTSGRLAAAGSQGSSTCLNVTMAPTDPGAIVGDLAISVVGLKEQLLCPVGASAVQSSYQLLDHQTKAPVSEVQFGELFFGESATRCLTLVNNGPTEACFDLSFGSVSDLKALLSGGPDDDVMSGSQDDRLAAFLQVARIRAKAREDKGTMLRVSPVSGVIEPYSSTTLHVTFKPFALDGVRGFKAQAVSPQQQVQPFDGLLQVNLSSGKHLRLPVKGCGLACLLKVQPDVLHFGIVPTYQWADQLLQLSNGCMQLPMQLSVTANGPYFSSLPAQLTLEPGGTGEVVLRYWPKGLGHHQAAMCVQVVSHRGPGKVLFEAAVHVQGSSLSLGSKQPLPGGTTATPETFILPRTLVNESDAAVAHLVAEKTYKRPHIWEVAENAERLEGIGSHDRFGVTQEVHQMRAAHSNQYTTFIRSKRTAAARKYLTQQEGEKDVNLGMQPYRGLQPPPLRLKQQVEPLWTVSQHVESAPVAQKLPPASVLAAVAKHKEWPETAQERTACSAALTAAQLSSLTVAPRQLDFGKLSPASAGQQHFIVTNPLSSPIHVVLNATALEGLSCCGPCSQVVPAGSSAKFVLQLHCHDTQQLREHIQYVINGCHFQSILVSADVVPVTLDVSDEELVFTFSVDNWDDHVEQALMLDNPHGFPVEYEWSLSSPVFTVSPLTGTVKPRSSCQVSVKWTPGSAAGGSGPKAARQQALEGAVAASEGSPSRAAPKAALTGAGVSRKLSNTGSAGASAANRAAAAASQNGGRSPSRPQSKESTSKQPGSTSVPGVAMPAAEQASASPAASARGTAPANGPSASGGSSSIPTNNSSITVELPADAVAPPPAAAASVGCQHTGYMTLKLKGGGDVPPKKVMLYGELPASMLKFATKELNLGPVPLFEQQTTLVQVKNAGSTDAAFRVLPNSQLSVSPERGQVAAESSAELEVALLLREPGPLHAMLELDLRGGKILRLPFRAEGVVPQVHIAESALHFPPTFIGSTSQLGLTLVNTTPVTATLMCDLMQLPEFELHLSRDAWASAGYSACPVKRIGANGEVSAVGSTRVSRRTTTHGMRSVQGGNSGTGCGYRFLITLQPGSSLPMQMVYRPSTASSQHFALPLALQHSYSGNAQSSTGSAGSQPASTQPGSTQPAAAAAAAGSTATRRSTTERRSATSERRTSVAGSGHSKPGSANGSSKAAAAAAHAREPATLAVPVQAEGVVPKVILSKASLDFGTRVARGALQGGKSPHLFDIQLRNNTDGTVQVAVGPPGAPSAFSKPSSSQASTRTDASTKQDALKADAAACSGAYAVEGWDTRPSAPFVSLGPDEALGFTVRFSPTEAREYHAFVPVYLDGSKAVPYMLVQLTSTGTLPRLTFDVAECVLPMVPLGLPSTARVFVINDGFDNLELSVRLPPDSARLPVTVSFPEGKLIGLAKERLPVDISCCSSRPLSFTTAVDLMDEDGRAFSLMVTGATDNCSLSHGSFMQLNVGRLKLLPPPGGAFPAPLRLAESGCYEMPRDEAVGPLHLTKGVCRFLSCMTASNWSKKARSGSKAGAMLDDAGGSAAADADAAAVLRQWLLGSRGKGLLELIETLGGRPVSLKGAAAGKAAAGSNKASPVQQLLAVYEAALAHLRAQGALLNTVKAEYLLPEGDFVQLMEGMAAAAAGNPEQEDALDYWAAVETSFGAYSAMAWNCVLLQMLKVYALARVTPTALRQLLTSMNISCATAPTQPPTEAPPGSTSGVSKQARTSTGSTAAAGVLAAAVQPSGSSTAAAAGGSSSGAVVVEAGSVPPDEVLSGSNIYSTAEACLLTWINAHAIKAFPKLGLQVTSFGDLRDGLALGALLAAYWPGDSTAQLLTRLHPRPASARHLRENQEGVVMVLQELCLPYEVSAGDLDEAEPQAMLLLVTYLFTALPQLLPRATLDFSCKLGDQQIREIQLSNPTRRPLSYAARLEGASDFSLEASLVKIDPGQSTQVPVMFKPGTALPKSCRLVLMSRRDNTAASAATLVFLLKGQADTRVPLKQINVAAPLYQLATQDFTITNPFPTDCDFSISVVPLSEQKGSKDAGKKDAKKDGKAAGKATTTTVSTQQAVNVAALLPEPFGIDRHRLRLKPGASDKLKLSFLPLVMPASAASAAAPAKGRKSGKSQSLPAAQSTPPHVRGLLVLKDSECGEFTYELLGEVGEPATFMQHEAKVSLDGQQTVELQLPFANHLLDNARRSYAEKHPLGRDKEQLSRLRTDIGSSNGRGERLLEYTATCDSPFFNIPASITLKSNAPAAPFQDATAASSPAVTSRVGSAKGAQRTPGSANQQQAAAAAGREAVSNVIKLGIKPVGPGVYPARLVLTSAYDIRQIELQVTAQARGQACVLELECPARQQVVQELPVLNAGSDLPLSATATLTGRGFSGPREVSVPAKADGSYPLTFTPPGSGSFSGSLELLVSTTGEKLLYTLVGKASEPLAEGHILVECQARSPTMKRLQVPNVLGSLPLAYSVLADADWLSGPTTLSCASANRGDTYKLSVCPLTSGTHWGSITFMAPDGQYCWFSVEARATEPPEQGTIQATCPIHQALAIKVTLVNPTDKPLQLRAVYGCCSLLGPAAFVAPAGPGAEATFECYYTPLVEGTEEGVLRLISREAGEFWWKLALDATPALPQPPIMLSAALGSTTSYALAVANPTPVEATFTTSSSCPDRFWLVPDTFKVAPNSVADIQLMYKPGSYQTQEQGTISVISQAAGSYEYVCIGQGEAPSGCQTNSISSTLGASATSNSLTFTNPLDRPVEVEVALSSTEEPGTFLLMMPGAAAPSGSQQQDSGSSVSWPGLGPDAQDGDEADAVAGYSSSGALDAVSMLGAVAAAALAEEQQQQPKQPAVQQLVRVTVQPGAVLQLPVAFAPRVLRQAAAQLSVTLLPDAAPPVAAAAAAAPAGEPAARSLLTTAIAAGPSGAAAPPAAPACDLVWRYELIGVARADAPGVKFAVKCVAKQQVELLLEVPLPGLDVEQAAAAAAAGGTAPAAAAGGGTTAAAAAAAGLSGGVGGFRYTLQLPEEHRAALAAAVTLEQLDAVPVPSTSAASMTGSSSAAACASVLRYKLRFAPQKALNAVAKLVVECGQGGACWMYDVSLTATAPDLAGILTLEAHLGCTAELPLYLSASGPEPQPFTAEFTPESPLNFDVLPSRGLLPAAPVTSSQEAAAGSSGSEREAGAAAAGAGSATEPAPLKVTFLCKELGKVVT